MTTTEQLPVAFCQKYQALLGPEEAGRFLESFQAPAEKGFRLNPKKTSSANLEIMALRAAHQPIPWSPQGYYGQVKGLAISQTSGAVYSQEPSAQAVAALAAPALGSRVLDLCAAPGGKTTQLASLLGETGLLVANEIDPQRAKILSENVERFGYSNVVVTNHAPEQLAQFFPAFFDLIVVDAPCSGEGMFRKDPDAIQYWDPDYPLACQQRQRAILTEALTMLKPNGSLVYSTCTFAPEEDEENIAWLLAQEPRFQVVAPEGPGWDQVDRGRPAWGADRPEMTATLRFWPQKLRGEGHFMAKLIRTDVQQLTEKTQAEPGVTPARQDERDARATQEVTSDQRRQSWPAAPSNGHTARAKVAKHKTIKLDSKLPQALTPGETQTWTTFLQENRLTLPDFFAQLTLVRVQNQLFARPNCLPADARIRFVRRGLWLGEWRKNRFVPNQALVMALPTTAFGQILDLSAADYQRFRHGETVSLAGPTIAELGLHKGWYPVAHQGLIFSWGYLVDTTIKNFYPKNLRTR